MQNNIKQWQIHRPSFEFTKELSIDSSAWSGHYFFAYDLVANSKPDILVELGTHKGNSFFSFAQAVKDFNLKTTLHAVDTWQGDKQAGYYGEEVYDEFLKIKDSYYKGVNLIDHRMLFDDALDKFKDNSIDILHIDGLHTYDAVKHDFEAWLPKVKKATGIILFHDVCEKSDGFGVYKLWEELQKKYSTITFRHYHGLGAIFLNDDISKITLYPKTVLPQYYECVSEINKMGEEINEKNEKNMALLEEISNRNDKIEELNRKQVILEMEKREFEKLREKKIWKIFYTFQKVVKTISKIFEIIWRLLSYTLAFPKLLTQFPLREIPLRIYVALRYVKFTEYNRDYQINLRQNKLNPQYYKRAQQEILKFEKKPLISIIMPVYNVDLKWIKKAIESVKKQIYSNWELCIADDASTNEKLKKYLEEINHDPKINVVFREKNGHISEASNSAISISNGEYLALMDNDDVIHPQALYQIVKAINKNPSVGLIYSDEDKMELNGTRCDPVFKSDYSPNYLLSTNYFCHLTTIKKDAVDKVGGFRNGYEGSQDYDLFLRVVEHLKNKDVVHIPDVLYSWRKIPGSTALRYDQKGYAQKASIKALQDTIIRRNIDGKLINGLQGGFFRITYNIKTKPLISLIITNQKRDNLFTENLKSILNKTIYDNYEIIIVSADNHALESTKNSKLKFLYFEEHNILKMRNFAVKKAKGEYLIFIDETLRITNSKWIEHLLEYGQQENIGAVGPKILSLNKAVLGTSFWLDKNNNIKNIHVSLPPHMQVRANLVANYSIILDISFMISKNKFEKVGGFNIDSNRVLGWIDFFLKLNEANLYNVYTPHLELISSENIEPQKIIQIDNRIGIKLRKRINSLERKLF